MRWILAVLFFIPAAVCFGQTKRMAHWYFGWEAGIDFSSGSPVADISGKLASIEGSSTISDLSGKLLFYSSGEKAWNRNHIVMPNGNDLKGNQSSTQSSLIVPLPGNDAIYYLFTSTAWTQSGLYYSVIDMRLDGGLGDITSSKNINLFTGGTEQLAGTKHCNGTDYWIAGRQQKEGALKFYAYRLSNQGVSDPVISEFTVPNPLWNTVGTLTFSCDGSLLAFCSQSSDIYLFDFDLQTGKLTLKDKITRRDNEFMYSNALSPDKKKLYTTSWIAHGFNYLSQFDLEAPDITASRTIIDSADYRMGSPNAYGFIGQVRLGPDQKIYVSRWSQEHRFEINSATYYSLDSIDVIGIPNAQGLLCQFQRNYLYLNHKPTMLGLPGFVSNFATDNIVPPCNIDPPCHYNINFSLGPDAGICPGRSITLKPDIIDSPDMHYLWQDGTTTNTYAVTSPGLYILRMNNRCGSGIDSVVITKGNCVLFIPNAFTPNGDGLNDIFEAGYGDHITKFKLAIYNRWGQKIFMSSDIRKGWNGYYLGKPQPPGTYTWTIIYDTPQLKNQLLKGTVTLVR